MNRFFAAIIVIVITINTIRYAGYLLNGSYAAYYFIMLAINLIGFGFGVYVLFFQKAKLNVDI